ncbi:hypothetical protein SBRY_30767 [Actinacidiphila bryophytorum]|uniref:Uncharacterized protein n=1 Tax=Actinacidiphila bryophytorum TaxID=1436133 RepID=A0A9W4H1M1_9ACTN|nr:hypothetical protein SBRY_30767 [Actinacidiphila bryophytorum]
MGAGARAAGLRQAVHPRLADVRRLGLGPQRRRPPARAAAGGRGAVQGALRGGVRAADRHPLVVARTVGTAKAPVG